MSEELMITKEDLVNWLNRPPSNDDLDLIGFITTRLENFYKLEQENKQLKECYCNRTDCIGRIKDSRKYDSVKQQLDKANSILTELEEYYKEQLEFIIELPAYTKDIAQEHKVMELCYEDFLNKIQELKEKYK